MKLRYETKRNPLMTGVLVVVSVISLLFILVKTDFTTMIFGKIGIPETHSQAMSQEQSADVLALWRQQSSQKTAPAPEQDMPLAAPSEQTVGQGGGLVPANEPGTVYQYTDASGMIVMVDDLEKVPVKYRAKMKKSSGMYGQQRTIVKVHNNQIWVPVTFAHKGRTVTALLLLDTGATNTSISPALARRLDVQAAETTGGAASLADGSVVRTVYVVVENATVGPKAKRNLNVQIMPRAGSEETGLLGMDFLGDFPHVIDTKTGVIRWQ